MSPTTSSEPSLGAILIFQWPQLPINFKSYHLLEEDFLTIHSEKATPVSLQFLFLEFPFQIFYWWGSRELWRAFVHGIYHHLTLSYILTCLLHFTLSSIETSSMQGSCLVENITVYLGSWLMHSKQQGPSKYLLDVWKYLSLSISLPINIPSWTVGIRKRLVHYQRPKMF